MRPAYQKTKSFQRGVESVKNSRRQGRSADGALTALGYIRPPLRLARRLVLLLKSEYGGYPLVEVCRAVAVSAVNLAPQVLMNALLYAADGPAVKLLDATDALGTPEGAALDPQEVVDALYSVNGGRLPLVDVARTFSASVAGARLSATDILSLLNLANSEGASTPSREELCSLACEIFQFSPAEAEVTVASLPKVIRTGVPLCVNYQAHAPKMLWNF